jgi:hypothetical protein
MKQLLLFILVLIIPTNLWATCFDCHARDMVNINEEVVLTANKYLYVREATNNNDAPEIDKWLKVCGLGSGYSYCAAFTVSMYKETFEKFNLKSPLPRTAGVAKFAEYTIKRPFEFKVISTKKMNWGIDKPQVGDLVSWKRGSSIFNGFGYMGHQGITISPLPNMRVKAIEGNTKAGEGGDQSGTVKGDMKYGHEGVYVRERGLGLNSKFPIVYFIRLQKVQYEIQ